MKVLVVGSGGREHALAWKLCASPQLTELWVAPGNAGMEETAGIRCVNIEAKDQNAILAFVRKHAVDFVVVGPDQALADGLVNFLTEHGVLAFGPTRQAAELEWSKSFAKEVMRSAGVPTAGFSVFQDIAAAKRFLEESSWPGWAVKADGLALGKGVVVARTRELASATLERFLAKGELGEAGHKVVVEELLEGPELSAFFLCDGDHAVALGFACDYKQLYDGAKGPNTGGMGAYTPVPWLSDAVKQEVKQKIVLPVLAQMQKLGRPFRGVLFVGLMVTAQGPKVIEFNARFGDPETQALLPTFSVDLLPWLVAVAKGNLRQAEVDLAALQQTQSAVHVVLAAYGYPGTEGIAVRKGDAISIEKDLTMAQLFYAGVSAKDGQLLSNGGRVLGVTATASTQQAARAAAYRAVQKIHFSGQQYRSDVGE